MENIQYGGGIQQAGFMSYINNDFHFKQLDNKQREVRNVEEISNDITSKTTIEDKQIIVEKYDSRGNLINRIPPGYVPLNIKT